MASSWNNWKFWKKFSFVSLAIYTPPVRRPGVLRLAATKSRKRECTLAYTKVPQGATWTTKCMFACSFYWHAFCLLSCPSELSWCIGQATWENPKTFWVSSVYFIFFSTFPRAVSGDFCIPNTWPSTLMYRITVTKPREFHLLQTTTSCKLQRECKRRSSNRCFAMFKAPVPRKSSKNNSNLTYFWTWNFEISFQNLCKNNCLQIKWPTSHTL